MTTKLNLARLTALRDHIIQMGPAGHDLLRAAGLDTLLPVLDQLTDTLPRLGLVAGELADTGQTLLLIKTRLLHLGDQQVNAGSVSDLLELPCLKLQAQSGRLIALL
ncbi:MAG: hypothetical protein JO171_03335 [Paludibacterium sp.]|uniref:hypothetical protein n=1 Tax=Paludibacterium sp. TaxID=1917523 RepID=UPI0025F80F45|nr:hypothetical protein [Paludibacterium sp.]MBV8046158.1 hypothetical protein [Paludibacterium sp.]MBV8648776.1 hypothetical protein [Paludibacterium sp.]